MRLNDSQLHMNVTTYIGQLTQVKLSAAQTCVCVLHVHIYSDRHMLKGSCIYRPMSTI
jgi:hypothetical protein